MMAQTLKAWLQRLETGMEDMQVCSSAVFVLECFATTLLQLHPAMLPLTNFTHWRVRMHCHAKALIDECKLGDHLGRIMQETLASQAGSIASLQRQNESHHAARMEQSARMTCLEDTLQQLQASVRKIGPCHLHLRIDARGRRSKSAWSLGHIILYPIATVARWLMNVSS